MSEPYEKSVNKIIEDAPSMSMEELESGSEDDEVTVEAETTGAVKKFGIKVLNYVTDDKFVNGFYAGLCFMTVLLGLTYKKTWDNIE